LRRAGGLIALALLAAGVGVGEAMTPSQEHVLLVGDSIMRQTGPALARQLGEGYAVHNEGVNGSGLLTPDYFDWPDQLEQDLARTDPDVVVFLFIGNYTDDPDEFWHTPQGREVRSVGSPAFAREWGRQTDEAMATIAETDARVVLVLPPPMAAPELQAVVDALRVEYERVAEEWDFVELADASSPQALGGPEGEWVGSKPTVSGEELPVRVGDTVHLAPFGQRLLAKEIRHVIEGSGP
jgi:hypothetical protein